MKLSLLFVCGLLLPALGATAQNLRPLTACTTVATPVPRTEDWPPPDWYGIAGQMPQIMSGEAPPANDNADVAALRAIITTRTEDQCAQALSELDYTNIAAFFGRLLTPDELTLVGPLLAKLRNEEDLITWPYKDTEPENGVTPFNRLRPFLAFPDLTVCPGLPAKDQDPKTIGSSFPSAHAAVSFLQAEVLALIFPQRKGALLDRARQIGLDREVLMVHYPSDVVAGQEIANRILLNLQQDAPFLTDLLAVKACAGAQAGGD